MCRLPSDEVLQHGTFTGTLAADDGYLGQVELHVHTQLGERILQLVHDGYQLLHAHVPGHRHCDTQVCAAEALRTSVAFALVRLPRVLSRDTEDVGNPLAASNSDTTRGCDDDHDTHTHSLTRAHYHSLTHTHTHNHAHAQRPLDNKTSPLAAAAKHTDRSAIVRTDTVDCACARAPACMRV